MRSVIELSQLLKNFPPTFYIKRSDTLSGHTGKIIMRILYLLKDHLCEACIRDEKTICI